jgi:transposase
VDVSAAHLDASIGTAGPFQRFDRTPDGIKALAAFCKAGGVALVAMEATGGYEKLPFSLLWVEEVPAAIVNPRAVRDFAKGMGSLEKTDKRDAQIIAWYAAVKAVVPQKPAGAGQLRLRALVTRLRQLTELRTSQLQQRQFVAEADLAQGFADMLALLARQSRDLETKIAALIDEDPLWADLDKAFRTLKGVADRTVARIMAEMPEIGALSGKAVAKLAGLAPLANDSGKTSGKRAIRGGRRSLRDILYLVAGVVARHEPDFKAFADKLSKAGKPKKLIRIALARKLLVRLNAKAAEVRAKHLKTA